ncbi:M14 family zinc carboxypeptidase [Draconibacterium halophilum]|uniref:Zinc carboxypeptidase n=1 Tax=Draconibacterium halophilum TaxID=2706887 RepID=A0A6C0RI25_9BACT|nr:M14 family zinc carboxypeptidase [Draconibacterium halophilum]QIA09305.1 zinc carboxypeptidase [Draconibacterium halophilum]
MIFSQAQENLSYFLPDDVSYNSAIPTPEEFFGQKMGEWHLTHDQVLFYIKTIAKSTNRAIFYEYARSYENRPLVHLVFSSPENQEKLDELKQIHYNFSEPGENIPKDGVPLVVSLTYGVHGNESSATNASVLTAYYLAAAEGEKIDELLQKNIVIIDPCLNPDGFTRHSMWANMHQSATPNGDSNSRQFQEVWPGGRTNHYWFDLNRDYLLLVHPESKGRVEKFHEWKPNIVTDHHEMGANSTFFFQPGVPSRNNPLTPEKNYELTHKIGEYHAQFLDKIGSTYFTEEQFDDYYYGKGSSYPDANGSIGILFEQGGFRGRYRNTQNGTKTLAYGIRNQVTTSLSTLEAALNLHDELLGMQKEFYNSALDLASKSNTKAYVFGSSTDRVKTQMFVDLLNRHQIDVYQNQSDFEADGQNFDSESSFIVPVNQKQYRLIKSMFEEVHEFTDTTFYDVSTWTFPHAYNLNYAQLTNLKNVKLSDEPVAAQKVSGKLIEINNPVGYLFRWNEYSTAEALYKIQNADLRTYVATKEFTTPGNGADEKFSYGSIFIPLQDQNMSGTQLKLFLEKIAQTTGVDIYAVSSGLTPTGIDLGSNSFARLTKPKILTFAGGNASSRDVGEIWHLFDQHYHIPVTLAESSSLKRIKLSNYTTIVLSGNFSEWGTGEINKLKTWVSEGGTLIAYKNATTWAAKNNIGNSTFKKTVSSDSTRYLTYAERRKEQSLNNISGAIFETNIDITHPLCYGYSDKKLAIFKSNTTVANSLEKKYTEPVKFSESPYLSGWVSKENINRLKNAPVVTVHNIGRGKLISYHDNMTFRGTWLGTNKLFSNSVFFGDLIR